MAVCFDPVLGELRNRDEPPVFVRSVKVNGSPVAPDAESAANIPAATTSQFGVTKLNASTNSTSQSEAATPSAVRAAYQLANNANNSSAKTGADNYFYCDNNFEGRTNFHGETSFSVRPKSRSDGKCLLTFFNDYGEAIADLSAGVYVYDPETGDYLSTYEAFSDYAVRMALVANGYDADAASANFDPWAGYGAFVSLWFGGSDRVWPFYEYAYDEESSEYTQTFWKNLYIGYPTGVWQYSAEESFDGRDGWRKYWFDLVLTDPETGNDLGSVTTALWWRIDPGGGIEARVEISPEFYCWDPEREMNIYAYPEAGFPYMAYASTLPDSPYYDPQYDGGEYMGWAPADDSPLTTKGECESAVAAALASHNADGEAHGAMIETAKRWRVYSTSYGSQSETLWITDRCIHYCQNSMYAGGDCTITLRIPDRIQGKACEFYVVRFQTGWACKIAKPAGMNVYPVEGQDAFGLKGIGLHIWHFLEFKWNPNNQQDPRCFFVEYYNLNRDQNSSS